MKLNLLLVDDDPDDLILLKEALLSSNNSYELKDAENGRIALNFLKFLCVNELHPCLIVSDINMTVLDGRELLAILKSDSSKIVFT